MLQKLTYAGPVANSSVYFILYGRLFDPTLVTTALEIEPTSIKVKIGEIPKHASWTKQFDAGREIDLGIYMESIVSLFEPKIDLINQIKKEHNLLSRVSFKVDVKISNDISTPYFPLLHDAIRFLYLTDTSVDFDLYKVK